MPYTSTMLGYLLGTKIPAETLAWLDSPTEAILAGVLADSINHYDPTFTIEAQCTNTERLWAIGVYRFYEWAVEWFQHVASFNTGGGQSEWAAREAALRRLRDYYLDQIPAVSGGAPGSIIVSSVTNTTDPYIFPRYSDR